MQGTVVKLDRGYPLVCLDERFDEEGDSGTASDATPSAANIEAIPTAFGQRLIRCEHATALVKGERMRAVIGDRVSVQIPSGHDKGIIEEIRERRSVFARKDPAERTERQVLAANFDLVIIAEPIVDLNRRRLERELVLAHETGTQVAVALTKCDLLGGPEHNLVLQDTQALAGRAVRVMAISTAQPDSIERMRACIPAGHTAILIGKSGVGKSSLVNALAGRQMQDTAAVRQGDGKGRHTTVDRVLVSIPNGGCIVDMPGIRGLGLWDADQGLGLAFADVEQLAASCRFRDCTHRDEPGCAVREAIESGELSPERVDSYRSLANEIAQVRDARDEARHLRGEKASDRKGGNRSIGFRKRRH